MTEPQLEAAIRAAPSDPGPRAVYADWLMERGDPRGELAMVQTALETARGGQRGALQLQESLLLERNAELRGPLEGRFDLVRHGWFRGFLKDLHVDLPMLDFDVVSAESWVELFGHPTLRFLQFLEVRCDRDMRFAEHVFAGLVATGPHIVSTLHVQGRITRSRYPMQRVLEALPMLEELRYFGATQLEPVPLPHLRELAVGEPRRADLDVIVNWPLEHVTLRAAELDATEVCSVMQRIPTLRSMMLDDCQIGGDLGAIQHAARRYEVTLVEPWEEA